jgi:hypothetical protein
MYIAVVVCQSIKMHTGCVHVMPCHSSLLAQAF